MIDTHIHFWRYHNQETDYAWISDEMPMLKQDRLPEQIVPIAQNLGIVGGIAVQARCSLVENAFLLDLAQTQSNQWIKGIVGWLDFRSGSLKDDLAHLQNDDTNQLIKGFRHIVQDEPNPAEYWSDQLFRDGVKFIQKQGFVYDLLCHQKDLNAVVDFAQQVDENWLILDHLGKPDFSNHSNNSNFDDWKQWITELAKLPHVAVKISGLVTEIGQQNLSLTDFIDKTKIYIETIWDLFGDERVLFGSDWSVCTLTHDYQQVFELFQATTFKYIQQNQSILMNNAQKIYQIKPN